MAEMRKKGVIFDLDNTLFDADRCYKIAEKQVYLLLKKHVSDLSYSKFAQLYKSAKIETHRELAGTASAHDRILYFQRIIEKLRLPLNPELVIKLNIHYWKTVYSQIKPFPNVKKILKKLKQLGFKIAILSDLMTEIQTKKLHRLKIYPYIDVLVTSEEIGVEKPNPAMFLRVLNKMELLPNEAIMVGDSLERDIEGAEAIGMQAVLISKKRRLLKNSTQYSKPTYVINDIRDIMKILNA